VTESPGLDRFSDEPASDLGNSLSLAAIAEQATPDSSTIASDNQQFRSEVGHISKHSGVLFLGTLFTVVTGYGFKVYLARVLGAEALGIYALGITLVGFVGVFNSLGLVEAAVRFAAIYRASQKPQQLRALLWRGGAILLAVNVLLAAIFLKGGGLVARRFYHSPTLARYIPWFAALLLLGAFSTFYGRILAGYKAVGRRTLVTNFIASPATMLLALLLITMGWGLPGYLLAQVLGGVLVIALLLILVWQLTPPEARSLSPWPTRLEPEVWSFSTAALGILLLEFLMGQVDKISLGFYMGARSVGIYAVAAAMVAYVSVVLNSVNQVFSPIIAGLHAKGDMAMLGRLYKGLTKWVLGLTLPLAITVMVCARPLMRIFGHEFEAGWPILIVGTAGQLVNCGVGSVSLLLLMSGNQRRLLRVQVAMAAFMVIACFALIPIWGIMGAAVAAAITNAGTNFWNLLGVRKKLGFSPFSPGFARLLAPSVASIVVALLIRREANLLGHDWLLIGISLLAAYGVFAAIVALTGLDADDRMIVNAILSRIWRSNSTGSNSTSSNSKGLSL
jgi:O-antigen/teichoic acid export membrane protein